MNILQDRTNKDSEKYLQNLVINNKEIQKYIIDNLGFKYHGDEKFTKGKPYINRILPDIKISKNNTILALVECKSSNINVTDYVRGIGQLYQYEYFYENNIIENKTDIYSKNFQTVYFYPSDVLKKNDFNVVKFKYPQTTKILQINLNNFTLRDFSPEQSAKFSNTGEKLIAICPYYLRDNRLFELYIILKYLDKKFKNYTQSISRTDFEKNYLREFKTPNNNNWRNAFISLSGLGFISNKNLLTEVGKKFSQLNFPEFCANIAFDFYKPYIVEIFSILEKSPSISLQEIITQIRKNNDQKDILFLTESSTRYLSSWLNMFRDDLGFLTFKPRSNERIINYNPLKLSKQEFVKYIEKFNKAKNYIDKLEVI